MYVFITDEDEDEDFTEYEYSGNMACDNSGFCSGASCPYFIKCQS
jgi:hypothetical protein